MENASSLSLSNVPKSTEKKRHYCCVCSNYAGKIVEERNVRLHRFPAKQELRRVWIRRIKLCYGQYVYSANDRLCSYHFSNGEKTGKNEVPSIFEGKTFNSSMLGDEHEAVLSDLTNVATEDGDVYKPGPSFKQTGYSSIHASVSLHDYCKQHVTPEYISNAFNKCNQTDVVNQTDMSTQTLKISVDVSSQTDFVHIFKNNPLLLNTQPKTTCDAKLQTSKPDLTIEDIQASDEQVMFYTGLPNSGTFYAMFDEMDDIYADGNRGRRRTLRTIDEFCLVLMRLRLGLLLEDLAGRFKISKSTCSKIVSR
ncbi:hypothetical protein SNE40_021160 [Patella caerulea]|uniref:THAP-type domain-containing protein n=1 Tax=Patella caerulea TaxID=87958 RepID=A0AAN8FYX9_PATCE